MINYITHIQAWLMSTNVQKMNPSIEGKQKERFEKFFRKIVGDNDSNLKKMKVYIRDGEWQPCMQIVIPFLKVEELHNDHLSTNMYAAMYIRKLMFIRKYHSLNNSMHYRCNSMDYYRSKCEILGMDIHHLNSVY